MPKKVPLIFECEGNKGVARRRQVRTESAKIGELGEIIRLRRIKAGLSQAGLAKLIGSKDETIMNIENNKTIPRNKTLDNLCNILNISESEKNEYMELAKHDRRNREALEMQYVTNFVERDLARISKKGGISLT